MKRKDNNDIIFKIVYLETNKWEAEIMDKKTMLKLFGEELLRSLVVLMAILIVGFIAFFVLKVRGDKKLAAENTTEQASTYSDEELQSM